MRNISKWVLAIILGWGGAAAFAQEPVDLQTVKIEKAVFAGGNFWPLQEAFDRQKGVIWTTAGFSGGTKKNPTYKDVKAGSSGHAFAVEVAFDPEQVSYAQLLDVFWHNIDPTVRNQQFGELGTQYRSAIFYMTPEQQQAAEESKAKLLSEKKVPKVLTQVVPFYTFYPASDDQQKFYKKNAVEYKLYQRYSVREETLRRIWGAPGKTKP